MFQRALKANKSNKPMQHKLDEFLLVYCLSPWATTDQSSSQLMFGRNVQTKLDLFKPDVRRTVNRKPFSDDKNKPYRCFDEGQQVLVRNYRPGWKWVQREIAVQTGPVSYRVCANETVWRRHADQLLPGPRSSHDPRFEAEAEYEETANVTPTENSVSRPPDDSQDEVTIAEVMRQTDTTANGNANQEHGSLSDGITTGSG
ncbi:uncharacterized protein LOC134183735 [Corticium candelabrum]|uniref:uncharacterized protein LOC134183735 n=1 Tax=Corticium candelabrum TaxID=121492 RepID=UPI002E25BFA1|nr:uncharacterized protein LOC134183735 [Corticium candelabrum]